MSRFVRRSQGGFVTLIELLVVAAIIVLLVWLFLRGGGPGSQQLEEVEQELGPARPGGPTTLPGRSIEAARAVDCKNNLRQLRTQLQIAGIDGSERPSSLRELGVSEHMGKCPVTGDPYRYDARTGSVNCTVQGHENY